MGVFEILWNYKEALFKGFCVNIQLSVIAWILGLTVGTLLGSIASWNERYLGRFVFFTSASLTAIPALVFLFWLHYPFQGFFNIVIDPFYTTVFTLSIINIFGVSNIIYGAIREIPNEYVIAARVLGVSKKKTFLNIKLPLIIRRVIPSLLLLELNIIHISLFSSFIGVDEIFRTIQRINAIVFRPVELYSSLAIFFLLLCLPIVLISDCLKKKYTRDLSER